jgi:GST-like protein
MKLEEFHHLRRWFNAMGARPAVQRAYKKAAEINTAPTVSEAAKAILFGQGRRLAA